MYNRAYEDEMNQCVMLRFIGNKVGGGEYYAVVLNKDGSYTKVFLDNREQYKGVEKVLCHGK